MKKTPTKIQLREQIEQHIDDYLKKGGEVARIDRGVGGQEHTEGAPPPSTCLFQEPKAKRTPLPEVVAELEARRKPVKRTPPRLKPAKPRRIPLYDDFGEIIRWVWKE